MTNEEILESIRDLIQEAEKNIEESRLEYAQANLKDINTALELLLDCI